MERTQKEREEKERGEEKERRRREREKEGRLNSNLHSLQSSAIVTFSHHVKSQILYYQIATELHY